jgi:hypothetical protein
VSEDFKAEMSHLLETGGKKQLERWRTLLEDGSKRKVRHTCRMCNSVEEIELDGLPHEEARHILKFLSDSVLAKPKEDAPAVSAGTDFSLMTDAQLVLMLAPSDAGTLEQWTTDLGLTTEEDALWKQIVQKAFKVETNGWSNRHHARRLGGISDAR